MIPNSQRWFLPPSGVGGSDIQVWYDSLSVKPSEGLWTDIQNLYEGMNTDGDWTESDLISIHAALETDEQRLRPFKTTSGDDFTILGSPNLNTDGFRNPNSGVNNLILTSWNPTDDGIKYTLNSAFIGVYGQTLISTLTSAFAVGSQDALSSAPSITISVSSTTTTILNRNGSGINSISIGGTNLTKSGLANSPKQFFASLKRISSTEVISYINNVSQNVTDSSEGLPTPDIALCGSNYISFYANNYVGYTRACIAGSSLIDHNRVAARLNTFFASRGLSIDNY